MNDKKLYIIAGCNGAGKTTASFTILPEILDCKEFVNAVEIAKGLSPFQPEKVSFETGRIVLNRINELLSASENLHLKPHYPPGAIKTKLRNPEITMTTIEIQTEEKNKILKGLEKVYEKLIEFKKQKNTELVILQDNKIVKIKPE